MKVEDILEKLVGFNTIKDKENKEIIDFIEEFLLNQDFKLHHLYWCVWTYNRRCITFRI